jgi:hypothetical protein
MPGKLLFRNWRKAMNRDNKPTTQQTTLRKPGPYSYHRNKDGCDEVWDIFAAGADRPFASLPFWDDEDGSLEATAQLLAAAPQLLETLKLVDDYMTAWASDETAIAVCRQIRLAISHAEKTASTESEQPPERALSRRLIMNSNTNTRPKFPLGQVVITRSARAILTGVDVADALASHQCGNWGTVCPEDWRLNDEAVTDGTRLLSCYSAADGTAFWIITEWDRTATTVLLPDDY